MSLIHTISPLLGSSPLGILLHALINQYLADSYCLTLVLEQPIDFKINIIYTYVTPNNETLDELTDQLFEVSEKGCSDYIVYMSDPQKFMAAFDQVSRRGNTRRSNRKIIILPYSTADSYVNQSLGLFSMKESTFVANMLLILPAQQEEKTCELYDLVTHEFVSLDNDQPLYLDQWDSCTQKFIKNVNLFPHDLKNLNGRIVRVACFTYKPYSLLDLDTALVKDQWGEIFENGTGIGILGGVVVDRADMGISALYSWYEEYVHLDFSAAAIRSAVTCIAPSPRQVN
ncbi:Ionotropic receptor [Operophtera brumata]|uniref:Ionotropic receptor n=1 Tax=Operophtera brumata TaxID=104452 RepID=A0A0L7LIL1_OPEBR|nr:Ionotropic receptor [Operophtera brumata]